MPGENSNGKMLVRGIQEGAVLPSCELAAGLSVPLVTLSLSRMQLGAGGNSWTERMLRLRDELGPFRLAYLEMLLRRADEEASADPGEEHTACLASN
jgi:CRISPR-associated endonuclease/helicase Cas3